MTYRITMLGARGIGEMRTNNMISGVRAHLDKSIGYEEVDYPAQYGPVGRDPKGQSFLVSLDILLENVRRRITNSGVNEKFILIGYSAGAEGMGNFIAAADDKIKRKIIAVCLIADPSMPRSAKKSRKYGIRGERQIHDIPVYWAADPKDPIPLCSPKPSPMRDIADATPGIGLGARMTWNGVYSSINDRIRQGGYGLPDFAAAMDEAIAYLVRGDHMGYGTRREPNGRTYLYNCADWINRQVASINR